MAREVSAVVLRPRTDWEAADLGVELARAWIGPLARVWLSTYLGPALLLVIVSPWPVVTAIAAWSVRPCAERLLLDVLARQTFGRETSVRAVLRGALWPIPHVGPVLASLTWRRFSPARTLWLAVWHLEGLRGAAARRRLAVLTRAGRGAASWCAAIGLIATALMVLSLGVLLLALMPDASGETLRAWLSGESALPLRDARLWAALVILADGLCAPWITAAVFGLYISRRTDLEAWDIEQVFRGLARRVAVALLVLAALGAAPVARAQEAEPAPAAAPMPPAPPRAPFDPQATIKEILAAPEFGRQETVQQWQIRPGTRRAPATTPGWMRWLIERVPGVAGVLRWGMWAVALALVGWLVITTWRGRKRAHASATDGAGPAVQVEGIDTSRVPVHDVLTRAREAVGRGALVDALGLLYAGALQACVDRGLLELYPGDTEAECLRRVDGRLPADAHQTLRALVRAWQGAAYARRVPSADHVRAMCDDYARHFDGGAA